MKYLVMECHFSYAILLDEEGRFVKAANLHYEVGQTVTDIVEMKEPEPVKKINFKWISGLAATAACFLFLVSMFLNNQTYASVFMVINPEVRIDVNRKNVVVGLEGVNEDGEDLIEGYSYKKKSLEPVMDELVDRAIDMGYLSDGEQITLTLDAKDDEWIVTTGTVLQTHIDQYLTDKITVTVDIANPEVPEAEPETVITEQPQTVVIPTTPENDGDSNYGLSDYGDDTTSDEGVSNYDDDVEDSVSNYDDVVDSTDDGVSSYDGDDGSDDGASAYSISAYETSAPEDDTNYDDSSEDSSSNYEDESSDSEYE